MSNCQTIPENSILIRLCHNFLKRRAIRNGNQEVLGPSNEKNHPGQINILNEAEVESKPSFDAANRVCKSHALPCQDGVYC